MTEMWSIAEPPLRMCAVEDEGFFIARKDQISISNGEITHCAVTLTKDEKFMLYQQLQQNIEIHHMKTGTWFLSPLGQQWWEQAKIDERLSVIGININAIQSDAIDIWIARQTGFMGWLVRFLRG